MERGSSTSVVALLGALVVVAGCGREPEPTWSFNEKTAELDESLRTRIETIVVESTGTRSEPRLPGERRVPTAHLLRGRELYEYHCQQCHGISGDGVGDASAILRPRPRNYRLGKFKFTSTPQGMKPRRDDLLATLKRGITGTSMPKFNLLTESDREAIVDYVLVLTLRGEIENRLYYYADEVVGLDYLEEDPAGFDEEFDELAAEAVPEVLAQWEQAEVSRIYPPMEAPAFTAEHVARGRELFKAVGCVKCHGEDGRGLVDGNEFTNAWGHRARAADLTSGMLHGGSRPLDLYRRIHAGIEGTPMISALVAVGSERADDPDLAMWDLVAYVLDISNRRRATVVIADRAQDIPLAAPIPESGQSVLEAVIEDDTETPGDGDDESTDEDDEDA